MTLVERLRAELREAMRVGARDARTALRTTLAAIDNAAAAPVVESGPAASHGPIAGAAVGVGATEVPRREVSEAEVEAIVRAEIADRRRHADRFAELGQADAAAVLRREADVLASALEA